MFDDLINLLHSVYWLFAGLSDIAISALTIEISEMLDRYTFIPGPALTVLNMIGIGQLTILDFMFGVGLPVLVAFTVCTWLLNLVT